MKGDPCSSHHIRDLRNRACRTESEPFSCHGGTILQLIECLIIDGGLRLQAEHDDRYACALHKREYCVRERVSRDIEKQNINIFSPALVSGFARALGRIDEAQVYHCDTGA